MVSLGQLLLTFPNLYNELKRKRAKFKTKINKRRIHQNGPNCKQPLHFIFAVVPKMKMKMKKWASDPT